MLVLLLKLVCIQPRSLQGDGETDMKRIFFWATLVSGGVAAYLMYRRGESLGLIAKKAGTDPFGSFAREVKTAL